MFALLMSDKHDALDQVRHLWTLVVYYFPGPFLALPHPRASSISHFHSLPLPTFAPWQLKELDGDGYNALHLSVEANLDNVVLAILEHPGAY